MQVSLGESEQLGYSQESLSARITWLDYSLSFRPDVTHNQSYIMLQVFSL